MPSLNDQFFAAAVPFALESDGEDVIYKPKGGTPYTIKAIVRRETRDPEYSGYATNDFSGIIVEISSRNDVEGRISPMEQSRVGCDLIEIDGHDWRVQRIAQKNVGGFHVLEMSDGGKT